MNTNGWVMSKRATEYMMHIHITESHDAHAHIAYLYVYSFVMYQYIFARGLDTSTCTLCIQSLQADKIGSPNLRLFLGDQLISEIVLYPYPFSCQAVTLLSWSSSKGNNSKVAGMLKKNSESMWISNHCAAGLSKTWCCELFSAVDQIWTGLECAVCAIDDRRWVGAPPLDRPPPFKSSLGMPWVYMSTSYCELWHSCGMIATQSMYWIHCLKFEYYQHERYWRANATHSPASARKSNEGPALLGIEHALNI